MSKFLWLYVTFLRKKLLNGFGSQIVYNQDSHTCKIVFIWIETYTGKMAGYS